MDKGVPVKSLNELKSVLASALASHGRISEALEVSEEIKEAECKLEPRAIICLIVRFLMHPSCVLPYQD